MTRRVMDLTGRGAASALRIEAAPAHELLVGLCAFGSGSEQGTLESGPEWFEEIRTKASRELLRSLDRLGTENGKAWCNLLGLVVRPPATPDVDGFIERVGALSALDARLYLLGY